MLVGIDVGSHKVCTLVGEALPAGGIRVLGVGHAPTSGVSDGEIVHVEHAAEAIAASVARAERVADVTISNAAIGMTGGHLVSSVNRASVPCGRRPRPMEEADVDRLLETAGTVPLPDGREVLHVLPRSYNIDGGNSVVSPLGMAGCQLGVDVLIVTADTVSVANLRQCLDLAEVGSATLVMSTLAAAEATLTDDERELGVFVVDLGAATTGIACFTEGSVEHCASLKIGGRHMTKDLAVVLQTPLASAERIKTTHGHVLPELDDDTTEIEIESFGDDAKRTATRHHVSEILAARADEIADLVWAELEEHDLTGRLPAGAVLVGGGSELGGLARRFCTKWNLPVRQGRPSRLAGLADAARSPSHAGAVGLLAWHGRNVVDAAVLSAPPTVSAEGVQRVWGWAKEAFLPRGNGRR
jgi:cell division protein FtsA